MGHDYLTDSQLKAIMPLCNPEKRKIYLPFINLSMAYFKINTEARVSMYLAQLAHESTDLTRWVENLNYSAKRLREVWPKRFLTLAVANLYAHNPQKLANYVYNGRMGNRKGSDDGYKYRGQGPIQATGREMFEAITKGLWNLLHINFVEQPNLVCDPRYAFYVSAWIFAVNKGCLPLADARDLKGCTLRINGGYTGLQERLQNYRTALAVLPDAFSLKSFEEFQSETALASPRIPADFEPQSRLNVTFKDAPEENPDDLDAEVENAFERVLSPADEQSILEAGKTAETSANEQEQPTQQAENITNVNTGSTVPPDFKPEEKTVEAPPPSGMLKRAWFWILGLGVLPTTGTGAIETFRSISSGDANWSNVFAAMKEVLIFILPYIFWVALAFLAFWGIKEVLKQLSFMLTQYTLARGDMNNVRVIASGTGDGNAVNLNAPNITEVTPDAPANFRGQ